MSIRIHALAKELDVPSKDLIDFINQNKDKYGLEIKTSSNAIAPLYADLITADFKASGMQASGAPDAGEASDTPSEEVAASEKKFVKTAEDVEQEKLQKQAEAEEKKEDVKEPEAPAAQAAPATPPPPPPPQAPEAKKPAIMVPPVMARRPAPMVPPVPAARPKISMPEVSMPAPKAPEQPKQPEVIVRAPATPPPPPARNSPGTLVPPAPMRRAAAPAVPPMPSRVASNEASQAAANGEKKIIQVKPPIIVREFAKSIELKPFRLISELMDMGIFASMNQTIEEGVAVRIAERHGFELDIKHRGEQQNPQQSAEAKKREMAKKIEDDIKNYVERPAIACILGHVDHGKTTLLDTIRHTNVVAGEAGGITQHTAAYQIEHSGKKITFLDTPGHAAFSKMRERGANITDIAILVVAADDGFMPQTDEALAFAQKADVPVIVAINKMDAKGANIDRVKQQMQKRGIAPEESELVPCGKEVRIGFPGI